MNFWETINFYSFYIFVGLALATVATAIIYGLRRRTPEERNNPDYPPPPPPLSDRTPNTERRNTEMQWWARQDKKKGDPLLGVSTLEETEIPATKKELLSEEEKMAFNVKKLAFEQLKDDIRAGKIKIGVEKVGAKKGAIKLADGIYYVPVMKEAGEPVSTEIPTEDPDKIPETTTKKTRIEKETPKD